MNPLEELGVKRTVASFLNTIITDDGFEGVLKKASLNQRPTYKVMRSLLLDIDEVINAQSLILGSEKCDKISRFYHYMYLQIATGVFGEQKFNLKKALIVLAFIAATVKPANIKILKMVVEEAGLRLEPQTENIEPIFFMFTNLLIKREKIPEVQKTLEEIRDSSVSFILNYLATGNKTILNFSEDILVMMVARKLYNAMYWYMYGKQ